MAVKQNQFIKEVGKGGVERDKRVWSDKNEDNIWIYVSVFRICSESRNIIGVCCRNQNQCRDQKVWSGYMKDSLIYVRLPLLGFTSQNLDFDVDHDSCKEMIWI